ncbi:MAG: glycosyltransferase family 1 protein [Thermoleophilia bacterium]
MVDADVLGRRRTGDESYVENLLRELPALGPDLRFAAVTRHPELVPAGVEPIHLEARSQIARMSRALPQLLAGLAPALAHFQYAVPLGYRGRAAITVHDLSFERGRALMPLRDRLVFRRAVRRSVRRADAILTVSEFSRRELVDRYGLAPDRIAVTPNGVDPAFRAGGPRVERARPYVLVVGALHPRKDPLTAVEAFALVDEPGLDLVLAGPDKGLEGAVRQAIQRHGLAGRVELAGHVDKEMLAALYRGAACLAFPSRYEGFGLPVLEAMACGTPVVASAAPAIPEVAGDAAILVPPGDPVALAGGIERALADRERLVELGRARAAAFTWRETARLTLAVYRRLLG